MSKKKAPLVSSRYAVMYTPATTGWDFFDAFAKSPQCQAAFQDSEISTKGKNVDKYLTLTAKERLRLYRESQRKDIPQPPQHILELVKIQSSTGKFDNLAQVLSILFMPHDVKFRLDHLWVEWEKATAFAIAAMRQQNEYFDVLCESHDKAFAWMESNEAIFEARELIHSLQFTSIDMDGTQEGQFTDAFDTHQPQLTDTFPSHTNTVAAPSSSSSTRPNSGTSYNDSGMLSTAELVNAFNAGLSTIEEVSDATVQPLLYILGTKLCFTLIVFTYAFS